MDKLFKLSSLNEECLPIKSLDGLKTWKSCKSSKHSTHPLQKRAFMKDCPKTLVCHDMKGGYLDDRFLNGSETEDNYFFIHWSMVDIFVYFSHNLVTIPPCGWITSAHRNGVKVLGTFITEWDAGGEICDAVLYDVESVHQTCLQLVSIANCYQFDGWLINVENKLTPNQVPLLEEFVKFLTLKMHESQLDSLVIWYDSVIETGELKWQNELNEHNRNFFHVCDGIFLNYNWRKDNLKKSIEEAGSRKMDVFVGVDVFGRGCLGGGGFSTDIAVTAARDFGLSVAIFAPGWVHECLDSKDFIENQYKFWNSLTELCAPREIESLPYYSSFCPGFGKKMFRHGKIKYSRPWYNISLQQPQPSYHYTNCSSDGSTISVYSEDAFNGGGCLQLKSKIFEHSKSVDFEFLSTNFLINTDCYVSYTYKPVDKNVKVVLIFNIDNGKKLHCLNFLDKSEDENGETCNSLCPNCITSDVHKVLPTSTKIIKGLVKNEPWIKRKYKLHCHSNESYFIKNVSLQLSWESCSTEVSILLGELSILPTPHGTVFSYKDLSVVPKDEFSVIVECLLEWTCDTSINFSDLYILADGAKKYICTTPQFCYRFKGCIKKTSELEFILNPNHFGKTSQSIFLKVPLDSDKNSAHHQEIA